MKRRMLMSIAILLAVSGCSTSGSSGFGWPFSDDAEAPRPGAARRAGESAEPALRSDRGELGRYSTSQRKAGESASTARSQPDAVIKFSPDNQVISREAESRLQAIAQQARSDEKLILRLEGFVPEGGSPALNLGLAEKSLQAVRARLLELRVPARRILLAPFGEEHRLKRDALQHWVEIYLVRPRL